jgi:predicted DNA-binding antitoxin AbrB/MazE fold protein
MRTIRAVFHDGKIDLLEPVDLPENTRLRVALLNEDDLPVDALARVGADGKALDFLNDPREDIYSTSDGQAV